jgi:hypothetical protein
VAAGLVGVRPAAASAAPRAVPARAASDVLQRLGLNTHFNYLGERQYAPRFAEVKRRLAELGVSRLRDGIDHRPETVARLRELHRDLGVRVLLGTNTRTVRRPGDLPWDGFGRADPGGIRPALEIVRAHYAQLCDGLEGVNEYDHSSEGDPDLGGTMLAYQRALWQAVKADRVLRGVPVVGLSLAHHVNARRVPDLGAFLDVGSMHSYPGPEPPTTGLAASMADLGRMSGGKPVWATETGYEDAIAPRHMPPDVVARYGPRLVAEYARAGVPRTYFYELIDEPGRGRRFGLLDADLGEKPVFRALRDTFALLRAPGPDAGPRELAYALEGDTARVHDLLLHRADGRLVLLVWQEVRGWDPDRRVRLRPADRAVGLTLGRSVDVRGFRPTSAGTGQVLGARGVRALELRVPDELLALELTPR